jgi:signal transduction histidine kinase/ActR/RegA family two-component response regulator
MKAVVENGEDTRVLVLAPRGRDAIVVADVLRAHSMDVCSCASMADLVRELEDGAGLAFVTEEALVEGPAEPLSAWVAQQPPWTAFPFIVLRTRRTGRRPAAATELLGRLGNVVLLERPLNSETMVSGARSALRTRARQYETRRHLVEQDVARETERLARAEALRANEALEFALDAAELGTFHCPFPLGPIHWNATCKEHFWLGSDAAVDFEVFFAAIHEEDRELTRAAITASVEDGLPYDVEYRTVSPIGEWRWLRAKGLVYRDDDGAPVRFDGVTLDISHQKELEAQREFLLDAEREARTTAERASRMKDEFLATLSHELRTPLSTILGWTHLLARREGADGELAKAIAVIERSAKAQARLIEDLLDVSRITSGNLQLDVKPVSVGILLDAVASSVKPAADARSVALVCDVEDGIGELQADGHRLQQVMWNLASNAIKFTPAGGCVILTARRVGAQLELSVTDTGDGITAEFLPHVFVRFRQADGSEARSHGGLGLGLAIVRQIVELHGGPVRAESDGIGRGARFTVLLPMAAERCAAPVASAPGEAEARGPAQPADVGTDLNGVRIVIVDDEGDGREMIARMLESRGATVVPAASADEALTRLDGVAADVLISDIGMPRVDGYELMRRVRRSSSGRLRDIPSIALTAFARPEDAAKARAAGFWRHLAKPVEPGALFACVAELTGRAAAAAERSAVAATAMR